LNLFLALLTFPVEFLALLIVKDGVLSGEQDQDSVLLVALELQA